MSSLNINSGVADQFYRYKMPRLIAKVEGKGNGIKTVIVNMTEIAKALSRPATYPTKYFGCELGAQTNFDIKHDRYIVNGSHDQIKLQQLLDGFIKKFVLCQECNNPETNLIVKKSSISQRCIACGHTGTVDMTHKLTTFILKNPPDVEASTTPGKKEKRTQKKEAQKKEKEKESVTSENGTTETNMQEAVAAQRASGACVDAPPEDEGNDDDDDWGDDVTDDAVKQRLEEQCATSAIKKLTLTNDLDKTTVERLDIFYSYVEKKKKTGQLMSSVKDIVAEAERLEVKDRSAGYLVQLLFNDDILHQIKEFRSLFLRLCHNNMKAQRHLLAGLEVLIGAMYKTELLPKVLNILKTFYDLDIIEEEAIFEWDSKPPKKSVSKEQAQELRNKARPFIDWLKEAEEEESDDEDGEEEDMKIVYSVSGKVGAQVESHDHKGADEEDDIDIDDI